MQDQLVALDRSRHCFSIGACAPAPNIQMTQLYTQLNPGQAIYGEVADEEKLVNGLNEHIYDLIVMPRPSDDPKLASFRLMDETLYFSLPDHHPLANREKLTFAMMDGGKMLVMANVGYWHKVHDRMMPNTQFLVQQDRAVFFELLELSGLVSFTSSFTMKSEGIPEHRCIVPISDPEASVTYYVWYPRAQTTRLTSFLKRLEKALNELTL